MSSFSTSVKNELARKFGGYCCCLAEIVALIRMCGSVVLGNKGLLGMHFTSENEEIIRKVLIILKYNFNISATVMIIRGKRLKKNNIYLLKVPSSQLVNKLFRKLGIIINDVINFTKDNNILRKVCCRKSYLRGAFLGGGSVNKPECDYHLELITRNKEFAKNLIKIMKTFKLIAKLTDRKDDYIVYLKDGNSITLFLQIIGTFNALLSFKNVRSVKDIRNQVNRLVNCETANLQKTVNAAVQQVDNIKLIDNKIGLYKLPHNLQEIADIRLTYPEASLSELVELMGKTVTKSGINHRLRKLSEIVKKINEKEEILIND